MDKKEAFTKFINKISVGNDKFSYSNEFDKNDCDCLSVVYNKVNKKKRRMFFVGEFNDYHSVLMLKKSVFDKLNSLISDLDTDNIYFVSFTQRNTIVFDLSKLERDNKLMFIEDSCFLDYTEGKEIDYIIPGDEKPVEKQNYKLDENGELVFETTSEFMSAPNHIQMRHVMERHLRHNLLPNENKDEMIKKYGTLEKVYLFVRERRRINYLAKYNVLVVENKYEIK